MEQTRAPKAKSEKVPQGKDQRVNANNSGVVEVEVEVMVTTTLPFFHAISNHVTESDATQEPRGSKSETSAHAAAARAFRVTAAAAHESWDAERRLAFAKAGTIWAEQDLAAHSLSVERATQWVAAALDGEAAAREREAMSQALEDHGSADVESAEERRRQLFASVWNVGEQLPQPDRGKYTEESLVHHSESAQWSASHTQALGPQPLRHTQATQYEQRANAHTDDFAHARAAPALDAEHPRKRHSDSLREWHPQPNQLPPKPATTVAPQKSSGPGGVQKHATSVKVNPEGSHMETKTERKDRLLAGTRNVVQVAPQAQLPSTTTTSSVPSSDSGAYVLKSFRETLEHVVELRRRAAKIPVGVPGSGRGEKHDGEVPEQPKTDAMASSVRAVPFLGALRAAGPRLLAIASQTPKPNPLKVPGWANDKVPEADLDYQKEPTTTTPPPKEAEAAALPPPAMVTEKPLSSEQAARIAQQDMLKAAAESLEKATTPAAATSTLEPTTTPWTVVKGGGQPLPPPDSDLNVLTHGNGPKLPPFGMVNPAAASPMEAAAASTPFPEPPELTTMRFTATTPPPRTTTTKARLVETTPETTSTPYVSTTDLVQEVQMQAFLREMAMTTRGPPVSPLPPEVVWWNAMKDHVT